MKPGLLRGPRYLAWITRVTRLTGTTIIHVNALHRISRGAGPQLWSSIFSFIFATRRSLQTDFYKLFINFLNKIQSKFNGLVLGLWPTLPQTYINIGPIPFGITWRQTVRQTDRQTDRQADRQTDRQTEQQTHRQTDKQRLSASHSTHISFCLLRCFNLMCSNKKI